MINDLEITLKDYKIDEIINYYKFYAIPMSINVECDYWGVRALIHFVGDVTNTVDVEVISSAKGDISANIKFIVYSSDKGTIKLEIDNPENWKPSKYNPFKDTLN